MFEDSRDLLFSVKDKMKALEVWLSEFGLCSVGIGVGEQPKTFKNYIQIEF